MKIDLKPCPFCGADANLKMEDYGMIVSYYVQCSNLSCPIRPEGIAHRWMQEAIAVWNTRKGEEDG